MTKKEFIEFALDGGCVQDEQNPKMVRNTINGKCTRIDDSFDETGDLSAVHHICVLGLDAPAELEDLYHVYSPKYWELINAQPLVEVPKAEGR